MNMEFSLPEVDNSSTTRQSATGNPFLDMALANSSHVLHGYRDSCEVYLRKIKRETPSSVPGVPNVNNEVIAHIVDPIFEENEVLRFYWEGEDGAYRLSKIGINAMGRPQGKTIGRLASGRMLYVGKFRPTMNNENGAVSKPTSYDEHWVNWAGRVKHLKAAIKRAVEDGKLEVIDHSAFGIKMITDEEMIAARTRAAQPAMAAAFDPFADNGY